MTGQVALVIRMILYPLAGALAARGIITADQGEAAIAALAEVGAAAVVYAATVIWSRIAARNGGAT